MMSAQSTNTRRFIVTKLASSWSCDLTKCNSVVVLAVAVAEHLLIENVGVHLPGQTGLPLPPASPFWLASLFWPASPSSRPWYPVIRRQSVFSSLASPSSSSSRLRRCIIRTFLLEYLEKASDPSASAARAEPPSPVFIGIRMVCPHSFGCVCFSLSSFGTSRVPPDFASLVSPSPFPESCVRSSLSLSSFGASSFSSEFAPLISPSRLPGRTLDSLSTCLASSFVSTLIML
mmetsp:Transcript_15654/g.34172  ORF Transcript_15654/g.34172 Transcript_15654/m.34172 type:complete len:232 (-) Transcript_15654:98-793(-)